MDDNQVLNLWNELKSLVTSLEFDVTKNAHGTVAAGTRARKGLRTLKTKCAELVKLMVATDKAAKPKK
jgi:hypothetical protein